MKEGKNEMKFKERIKYIFNDIKLLFMYIGFIIINTFLIMCITLMMFEFFHNWFNSIFQ
jgi:hypothetical protein